MSSPQNFALSAERFINQDAFETSRFKHNQILFNCSNKCFVNYEKKELIPDEKSCLEKCFYDHLESLNIEKIK
jgi:hypothetical protein